MSKLDPLLIRREKIKQIKKGFKQQRGNLLHQALRYRQKASALLYNYCHRD
jgi:hypothetical protein